MVPFTLGPIPPYSFKSCPGVELRLHQDLRKTVVFIGHHGTSKGVPTFDSKGAGFLVGFRDFSTLVTNKHVALGLGDDPFAIRVNRRDGSADLVIVEGTDESRITWDFHPDPNVDLAVAPFGLDLDEFDALHLPPSMLLTQKNVDENAIGVGDIVHTVGLFRFMDGKNRNLPVVFTGNIAMLPGEEFVPVEDWEKSGAIRYVQAFLIEGSGIDGMSGSPVFVRLPQQVTIKNPDSEVTFQVISNEIKLLGVWSDSFSTVAPRILANGVGSKAMIPVGVGVVVPAAKLLELYDSPAMKVKFEMAEEKRKLINAARKTSIASEAPAPQATDENPTHREDFTPLLNVASKTPKQGS